MSTRDPVVRRRERQPWRQTAHSHRWRRRTSCRDLECVRDADRAGRCGAPLVIAGAMPAPVTRRSALAAFPLQAARAAKQLNDDVTLVSVVSVADVAVTGTEIWHVPPSAPTNPLTSVMDPCCVDSVPPHVLDGAPVSSVMPAGNVSVKPTCVASLATSLFRRLIVRMLRPPELMADGLKLLAVCSVKDAAVSGSPGRRRPRGARRAPGMHYGGQLHQRSRRLGLS